MSELIGWVIIYLILFQIIIIHELAHGWMLKSRGFKVSHTFFGIPPIAKIRIAKYQFWWGPIPFAGAVVPVDTFQNANLKDKILVALAGCLINILIGLVLMFILYIMGGSANPFAYMVKTDELQCYDTLYRRLALGLTLSLNNNGWLGLLAYLCLYNLLIGILNLIPLPPLDGGRILMDVLSHLFGNKVTYVFYAVALLVAGFVLVDMGLTIFSEVSTALSRVPSSPNYSPC